MAISFVSASQLLAATFTTLPTHQAGDLIVIFALRSGSTTPPTVPAGFTTLQSVTGSNTCGASAGYKIATSSAESSGNWSTATGITCHVYRGAGGIAVDNYSRGVGTTTPVTFPAITTLDKTNNTSWIVRFAGGRSADSTTLSTNAPSGYTNRSGDTTSRCKGCDTNGTTSTAPTADTQAIDTGTAGWEAHTYELLAYVPPVSGPGNQFFMAA